MGEKYMKESEIYRSFIDFWDKGKTFGECLDAVPKYTKEDILGEEKKQGAVMITDKGE